MVQQFWPSYENDEVFSYLANHSISWGFSPAYMPTGNSLAEIAVKQMKISLRVAVGRLFLSFPEMETLLVETESFMNSRPLFEDSVTGEIVTPAHYIAPAVKLGSGYLEGPELDESEASTDPDFNPKTPTTADQLEASWRFFDNIRKKLWSSWIEGWVLALRENPRISHKQQRSTIARMPKIGEIVLVAPITGGLKAPGVWPLARITSLDHSRSDGAIRSAEVKTSKGTYQRPVSHLVPLELQREEAVINENLEPMDANDAGDGEPLEVTEPNITTEGPGETKASVESSWSSDPANNRYRTRLSTGAIAPKLYTAICTLLLLVAATGADNAHPNECKFPVRPIEGQKCIRKGIVIYQEDRHLCWSETKCQKGLALNGRGGCGPECKCGEWAERCNFFFKPVAATPQEHREVLEELGLHDFCSKKAKDICDPDPVTRTVWRVMLNDQTKYYIEDLNLDFRQPRVERYKCVGPETGTVGGTPDFCQNHACQSNATRLCYYEESDIFYLVHNNIAILIKSYGKVPIRYFPNKKLHHVPKVATCHSCKGECTETGVELSLEPGLNRVSVCLSPWCSSIGLPKVKEYIEVPSDLTMKHHQVTVKFWAGGKQIKTIVIKCGPRDFCKRITCNFCFERLHNPSCNPWWSLLLIGLVLYVGSSTILTVLLLLKELTKTSCCIMSKTVQCISCCCGGGFRIIRSFRRTQWRRLLNNDRRLRQEENVDLLPRRRYQPRLLSRRAIFMAVILWITVTCAGACRLDVSMTAQKSVCSIHEGGTLDCRLTEGIRLGLVPNGQDTCLLIRDHQQRPIGTLAIEVQQLGLKCARNVHYFTRSISYHSQSVKRCASAGSCSGEKCGRVKNPSTRIDELSDEAKNYPGHSGCFESCGCAACDCFLCSSSCLFYRWYVKPVSPLDYTVFSCPRWLYQLQAKVRLIQQDGNITMSTLDLHLGQEVHWGKVHLSLVSITEPPSPILGKSFLSNGVQTRLIDAAPAGQPLPGMVGSIQCRTQPDAEKLACSIAPGACECEPRDVAVHCTCPDGKLEHLFLPGNPELLPLTSNGLQLSPDRDSVIASYDDYTALELMVEFRGMRLVTKSTTSQCSVNIKSVSGCYDCSRGASLEYVCSTDFGEALAHVSCDGGDYQFSFSTPCSAEGTAGTASVTIPVARPKATCSVSCPAGDTTTSVSGSLVYIGSEPMFPAHGTGEARYVASRTPFQHLKDVLDEWGPINLIGTIVGSAVALIATVILGPPLLQALVALLLRLRRRKKE